MEFRKTNTGFIIRLELGDKIIESLIQFCFEQEVKTAELRGLGAATNAEIGFFDLAKKDYQFKKFEGNLEIASLLGNVTGVDNKPFIHCHIVLGDKDFKTYSGHLNEATVGPTCEIFLELINTEVSRRQDENIGLKLMDL